MGRDTYNNHNDPKGVIERKKNKNQGFHQSLG